MSEEPQYLPGVGGLSPWVPIIGALIVLAVIGLIPVFKGRTGTVVWVAVILVGLALIVFLAIPQTMNGSPG